MNDVCGVLGIGNAGDVKARLDEDVVTTHTLQTAGGMQNMTIVNEDGLYDVILDSKKPEAKSFRKWITHEVIPSIRKTGSYGENVTQEYRNMLLQYNQSIPPECQHNIHLGVMLLLNSSHHFFP
ncbi:BRO-N domain-containing protein [Paenibacillus odorifer]|uniref:BRO-N domain-containing protein n=1 Tax=Paenibacillus odorifer TaxID=189426 RepID=UPI0020BEF00A|nr:Bro-N domain-containing protein [Paenibacillus odorifer]